MSGDGRRGDSDTRRLGEANKRLVLNAVRRGGAVSVDHLVRETGRSQPTVLKWLNELEREGVLRRGGRGRSTGGRRPVLYRFDGERGHVLGIAVEIPAARLALVDLRGREVATRDWHVEPRDGAARLLDEVSTRSQAFAEEQAAEGRRVVGAAVALSGFIDRRAGLSLATPRLAGWRDVPVRDVLAERLGVPVSLHHHIDALTLSETCSGAAGDARDFLYFDVGYGLGLRAVRGGEHVHGQFGNAGLVGHTTVVPDGRRCLCGNRGCLEEYVSGRALLRDGSRGSGASTGARPDEVDDVAERLFAAARVGDAGALRTVREFRRYLAIGIANAINLFDVPRVVVSGFVRIGGEAWRRALLEEVRDRLQTTLARHTEIRFSALPRARAGGCGAALFALRDRFPDADPLVVPDEPGREVSTSPSPNASYTR